MNICGNTCHMDCNGHRNCLMARYNWCNFGKLGLMLGFGQRKYPLLPFVIGLFTHAIFFTPAFHSQSAIPAFRDPPGPHSQLVLLIQLLQFCTHNKNHPRIADSTRESRILSATIREYCVTLSFCAQVAVSFDGYPPDANSGGTLRNVPPLLSHRCLYAGSFDGYVKANGGLSAAR